MTLPLFSTKSYYFFKQQSIGDKSKNKTGKKITARNKQAIIFFPKCLILSQRLSDFRKPKSIVKIFFVMKNLTGNRVYFIAVFVPGAFKFNFIDLLSVLPFEAAFHF